MGSKFHNQGLREVQAPQRQIMVWAKTVFKHFGIGKMLHRMDGWAGGLQRVQRQHIRQIGTKPGKNIGFDCALSSAELVIDELSRLQLRNCQENIALSFHALCQIGKQSSTFYVVYWLTRTKLFTSELQRYSYPRISRRTLVSSPPESMESPSSPQPNS